VASRVRWGQCFLVDHDAARRIVEWAAVDGLAVVEIGPGRGALTGLLRERASSLTLIEIDPVLAAAQRELYRDDARVRVVEGDALRVDWLSQVEPGFTVVANLPYESGTAIVAALLRRRELLREMSVMLQKEVVARLSAAPGSKVYGGLSVLVQMIADVEPGMVIAPRSFRPRPAVESRMVRIRPLASPRFELGDEAEFAGVVHAAFGQRRKMLRNNLGRYVDTRLGAGAAEHVLAAASVPGDVRPEDLGLAEFAALTRAFVGERDAAAAASKAAPQAAASMAAPHVPASDAVPTGERDG
jgi:16S rRNA (adenine1518-N6/adenine1519-N6)-dimethyltransferase